MVTIMTLGKDILTKTNAPSETEECRTDTFHIAIRTYPRDAIWEFSCTKLPQASKKNGRISRED